MLDDVAYGVVGEFEITIDNEPDRSSTFWLLLPLGADRLFVNALKLDDETVLKGAMVRYGVRYLEQGLSMGWLEFNVHGFARHAIDDVEELVALARRDKTCSYQRREKRDLFCEARPNGTPCAVSRPTCQRCCLPDDGELCSALSHPNVGVDPGTGHVSSGSAVCNAGRDNLRGAESIRKCRVGGYLCGHRVVEAVKLDQQSDLSPEQLPEMLDFLDATWRLAFGKDKPLLRLKTATGTSLLSKPCRTRGDFIAAISALDDLFKSMTVAEDLLGDPEKAKDENKGDKTLNRIGAALRSRIKEPADLDVGAGAIKKIRAVNDLRQAFQHGSRAQNMAGSLEAFGLGITPDWTSSWDRVRVVVAGAVADLRKSLQTLSA
jgi:hypothetical protein